jgi:Type II secretion system (T2SS), protein E, N-terminal domain
MSTPLRERPDAPLGTLIFRAGLLPAETIESALEEGVKTGKRLGEILTERGLISEVDLARLLAGQKGLEFVTLQEQIVDPSAAGLFTEEQARLFRALPYAFDGELPVVAIVDPTDDVLIRNIREALGREDARFVVAARSELADIAADVYSRPLQPRSEAEPEPEQAFEPPPAAGAVPESAHANGHAPADAELVLEPVAPGPEPVAPAHPAFQVPLEETPKPESLTAPEPLQAPEPEPVTASEPEPPVHPETQHLPEPAPPVEPEPPVAQEPVMPAEPVPAAPEATPESTSFSPAFPAEPASAPDALTVGPPVESPPEEHPEPVAAEPVPFPQPAPSPRPAPYPPAAVEPLQEPQPEPEPAVDAPEPAVDAPETPAPVAETVPWRMTIRLSNGEQVDAGKFSDEASAKQEAKAIMMQVAAADADDWPYVNGRFLKPDTIVSVDIAEDDGSES